MTYRIELTRQYLKDLKLARKRGLDERLLNEVIRILSEDGVLPAKNRGHALVGNFVGLRECHISPDWLLLYSKDKTLCILTLIRNGSHSDLF